MSRMGNEYYTKLKEENKRLELEVQTLKVQLDWYKRNLFGKKSERFVPNDLQLELPLDVEPVEVELTTEHIEYERTKVTEKKKEGHGRGEMPTHLPIKDTVIEPEDKTEEMRKIGETITWELDFEPGEMYIHRYIRPKYVRKDKDDIVTGKLPNRPIDKGNFGPGIMSNITVEKYLYHMPLYRQGERFNQYFKVKIAESTMSDIVRHTYFWLEPVYEAMKNELLQADYLMADETPIPVIVKLSKKKSKKCWYWVYYDPLRKITVFEYQKSRGRDGPNGFLKNYKNGILHVDGYAGYNAVIETNGLVRSSCMAHVRRKFENALEYNRNDAEYALSMIKKWFAVDADARKNNLNYEERLALRNENKLSESFDEFKKWMQRYIVDSLPTDPIRKASEYALNVWDGFKPFLTDGRVELSTNLVENAIRPVTLGRKNYLFKGSEKSAHRGAVIYSVINTAKQHGLNPQDYIKMLLKNLPNENAENINNYLPWNIDKKLLN